MMVCWDVRNLVKTDVPEIRSPWFAERHDFIDKTLFVAVSKCGLVMQQMIIDRMCSFVVSQHYQRKSDLLVL